MLMRRYFALVLMLFTVMTNTAEGHTSYSAASSSSIRLVFVSKLNEIINLNIQKSGIAVKKQVLDKKGFGDALENQVFSSLAAAIILLAAAVFCCLFINNGIVKNSIWKSTVF